MFSQSHVAGAGDRRDDQVCILATFFWLQSRERVPQTGSKTRSREVWQQFQRKSWWWYVLMDFVLSCVIFCTVLLKRAFGEHGLLTGGFRNVSHQSLLSSPVDGAGLHFYCKWPLRARSRGCYLRAWALRPEVWLVFRVLGCGGPSFCLCRTLILVQSPGTSDTCSEVLGWGRGLWTWSY